MKPGSLILLLIAAMVLSTPASAEDIGCTSTTFRIFGANDRVIRFRLPSGRLTPTDAGETVARDLPNTGDHISKTVVIADHRQLFVNIGSASNSATIRNACFRLSFSGCRSFVPVRSSWRTSTSSSSLSTPRKTGEWVE